LEQELRLSPIGVIRSPYHEPGGTPIQPAFGMDVRGEVEVFEEYADALDDLDGFERIFLIYWFHRSRSHRLRVVPYRDTRERGLFATRAPSRPNPIGLSVVRLLGREGNRLKVEGLDVLDGTPLLDIKPYIPRIDAYADSKAGWFDAVRNAREVADERFHQAEAVRISKNEVVLRLGVRGCIETTARHVRQKLADALMGTEAQNLDAEGAVELLTAFLEQTDFKAVRTGDEQLAGQHEATVRIFKKTDGGVDWLKI
jgi:tRNA-Thr(GGU) m(6)t(6)A37 methyltransferase TsaA